MIMSDSIMKNSSLIGIVESQVEAGHESSDRRRANASHQGSHQESRNQEAVRRLPDGEMPNSKNTLRSFESRSYLLPVTPATAIIHTGKPTGETTAEVVSDTEIDSAFFTVDDPVLEAVAAPILEEAEAILCDNEFAQPSVVGVVPFDIENPGNKSREKVVNRRTALWLTCVGAITMIVLGVVLGGTCATRGCRRNQRKSVEDADTRASNKPTNAPSINTEKNIPVQVPTIIDSTRADAFVNFINSISLSGRPIRNDANGTSEDIALNWLIDTDPFSRTATLQSISDRFRITQRYALSTLFFQQNVEKKVWRNTSGWLIDVNECKWYGIDCTNIDLGGNIGDQREVRNITLLEQNISGTIPSELGLLSSMEGFAVGNNYLHGTIPQALDRWVNLTIFYVFDNELSGSLPSSIGQWTNLKKLSVTFNRLTGSLPSSTRQWTNLESLSLFNNQFTGTIPDFVGKWSNLQVFHIRHNQFNGSLPNSIGQWTSLLYTNLTDNPITGTIPASIGNWKLMRLLTFRDMRLTGSLPSSIGQLTNMHYFDVSSNLLSGTIPSSVGNWSVTTMTDIGFHQNNFTGVVPLELCEKYYITNKTVVRADCLSEVSCECCECCECY
jgi:hypothetical protein